MPCPVSECRSTIEANRLCTGHERQLHDTLGALWRFYKEAHDCLLPTPGAETVRTGEINIGVNVAALSWINGNDLLLVLGSSGGGGWERVIREQRNLAPAGLLPPVPGITEEIARLIAFHQTHLPWTSAQAWADAYWQEIKDLHAVGMAAARAFVERHTRIHCPSENADGLPCRAYLSLNPVDPLDPFACRGCGTEWTTLRLVAVAKEDRSRALWVDVETAAALLGRSESQVRRVARKVHGDRRRRDLVNLHALMDFYAA